MRSAVVVAAAIALVAPSMPTAKREQYARLLVAEGRREGVDPLLVVAIVEHESRWRKGAVSKDGEDFGLGQLRARFLPECRTLASARCVSLKSRLTRDAAFNLRRTVRVLGDWRRACRPATETRMVAGYSGGKCGALPRAGAEILGLRAGLLLRLHLR